MTSPKKEVWLVWHPQVNSHQTNIFFPNLHQLEPSTKVETKHYEIVPQTLSEKYRKIDWLMVSREWRWAIYAIWIMLDKANSVVPDQFYLFDVLKTSK